MKEIIENIDKKIKYVGEYRSYLENKLNEINNEFGYYEGENILPKNVYEMEHKIKDFQYLKLVLEKLEKENIDVSKKYFFTNNIYLKLDVWNNSMTFHISLEDDGWFYENYISSHSGLNEWIFDLVNDEYSLFSGNSSYSYAFGTYNLKDYKRIIENTKENFYSNRKYSADEVVNSIKNLIDFFTNEENKTRNIIIDMIDYRIAKMKEIIERS